MELVLAGQSVVVCGSRAWSDRAAVAARLAQLPGGCTVITGGAPGADQLAAQVASELGLVSVVVPADWAHYGRAAGAVRNQHMLSLGPVLVLAFWDGSSRGTADMVRRARAAGVPVEVITTRFQYALL